MLHFVKIVELKKCYYDLEFVRIIHHHILLGIIMTLSSAPQDIDRPSRWSCYVYYYKIVILVYNHRPCNEYRVFYFPLDSFSLIFSFISFSFFLLWYHELKHMIHLWSIYYILIDILSERDTRNTYDTCCCDLWIVKLSMIRASLTQFSFFTSFEILPCLTRYPTLT